jgi:hypothetical protein
MRSGTPKTLTPSLEGEGDFAAALPIEIMDHWSLAVPQQDPPPP